MKRRTYGLLYTVIIACMSIAHAQQMTNADPRVADLVRAGKVRIGVFPATQFFRDLSGEPRGIAIEMARMLAARIGICDVITVEYPSPPMVVECVRTGGCDLGFMSYDPERAKLVDFAAPHIRRDFTYLVPGGSSIHRAADANRPRSASRQCVVMHQPTHWFAWSNKQFRFMPIRNSPLPIWCALGRRMHSHPFAR